MMKRLGDVIGIIALVGFGPLMLVLWNLAEDGALWI